MFSRRRVVGASLAAATAAVMSMSLGATVAQAAEGQVLYAGSADAINGSYIVVFKDATMSASSVSDQVVSKAAKYGSKVTVDITHTYRGDLVIDLISPSGKSYRLKDASGDSADNVNETYTVDLSGEAAIGTWTLSVQDVFSIDTGTLNSWTLDL